MIARIARALADRQLDVNYPAYVSGIGGTYVAESAQLVSTDRESAWAAAVRLQILLDTVAGL